MGVSVISWSLVFPWVILVKCNAGRQIRMLLSEIMVGQKNYPLQIQKYLLKEKSYGAIL